jgi:O-antigen ligase/polysaccharide polymerase Wzy-like membrane protein
MRAANLATASEVVAPATSRLARLLAVASGGGILALTLLRVADAPSLAQELVQVLFLASFVALAIVDFRASVAIAVLELAVYGAGGHWTQFAGAIPGRITLDAIVTVRAVTILGREWQRSGRVDLGRYGPHALFLALVFPGIWMSLGLFNGNRPSDVFGDGNGLAFFGFTIVLIVLLQAGDGPWIRQWLLISCAVNAVVTGLLVGVTVSGFVAMGPALKRALFEQLSFGGNLGYLSNGAYRLYLGSGIYLQVGLALTTWRLLSGRPRLWLWALYVLLWADALATYTRGYWLGCGLAVGIVVLLGATNLRRPLAIAAFSIVVFALSSVAGSVAGFSLPDYVLNRTASALSTGPGATPQPATTPPIGTAQPETIPPTAATSPTPLPGRDIAGEVSNEIKAEQTRVLAGHIVDRPIFGHGFGSIAADYRFGQIYSYELAYLDLLFKTGIVGLVLFLSFPVRFLIDALRGRFGQLPLARGVSGPEAGVVVGILVPLLITGGTNPYLLAAFGLFPILAMIMWLDPIADDGAGVKSR